MKNFSIKSRAAAPVSAKQYRPKETKDNKIVIFVNKVHTNWAAQLRLFWTKIEFTNWTNLSIFKTRLKWCEKVSMFWEANLWYLISIRIDNFGCIFVYSTSYPVWVVFWNTKTTTNYELSLNSLLQLSNHFISLAKINYSFRNCRGVSYQAAAFHVMQNL